jgi:hypothetical protein
MIKALKNIILVLFVLVACKNKSQQDDKAPTVFNLTNLSRHGILKLSDINVKDVEYIPLETNQASLFNGIYKIIVSGSDIYISDFQGSFLRFGNNGSFKNRFNKRGRGAEEYLYADDFTIDPNCQDIYINAPFNHKIYCYTNQGRFLDCFSAPKGTKTIVFNNDEILCHRFYSTGQIESYLVNVDKKGNVLKNFPTYKYKIELNNQFGYINEIIWFRSKGSLYIKDIHSDTVFLFNNNQLIPQYILNHGGKTISIEARSHFITEENFIKNGPKYSVEINVWRFGNYIISEFMSNSRLYIYAGEINGHSEHLADLKLGIINDINGGPNLKYNTIYYYDDNTILSWVNACELIAYVHSETFKSSTPKYPEKKKELKKMANRLHENDNPVLMLVKLKE